MRETLERHLVQRAAKLVEETIDERREELAERLAELEHRTRELAAVESKLARLGARLDAAGAAEGTWADRVEHLVTELEDARVGVEREQQARRSAERDLREALLRVEETEALSRRAAKLDAREAALERRAGELDERVESVARGDLVRDRLEQAPELLVQLDVRQREVEERERRITAREDARAHYIRDAQAKLAAN